MDEADAETDDVAPKHSLPYQRARSQQEHARDFAGGHAECFKEADGGDLLEKDDQDGRYHVEAGDGDHKEEDHQDVEVEERQPVEEMAVEFLDVGNKQCAVVFLHRGEENLFYAIVHCFNRGAGIDADFDGRDLVGGPAVEPLDVAAVDDGHLRIDFFEAGIVEAAEAELADFYFIADVVNHDVVTDSEAEFAGGRAR